jgi:hypothetical protein
MADVIAGRPADIRNEGCAVRFVPIDILREEAL